MIRRRRTRVARMARVEHGPSLLPTKRTVEEKQDLLRILALRIHRHSLAVASHHEQREPPSPFGSRGDCSI
jgi:hypothetical protein